jgi:hypothetical protein
MLGQFMNSPGERRSHQRHAACLPVSVRSESGQTFSGETRDLSTSGIFLYTASRVQSGNLLEMILMLPEELTGGRKHWICCKAEVVRVEESAPGGFGIAASIRAMEPLPEILG